MIPDGASAVPSFITTMGLTNRTGVPAGTGVVTTGPSLGAPSGSGVVPSSVPLTFTVRFGLGVVFGRAQPGVPVTQFNPFVPLPNGPVTYRQRVGYFGGFNPTKGVDVLLKAARKLPDVQFVLFTNAPEAWQT